MEILVLVAGLAFIAYLLAAALIWQLRRCNHDYSIDVETLNGVNYEGSRKLVTSVTYVKKCSKCGHIKSFTINKRNMSE